MRIPAKSDDAVRAVIALARSGPGYRKAEDLAAEQDIPLEFLQNILRELRRGGVLEAKRGYDGGYRLARPADTICVGEVLDAIDSPITKQHDPELHALWEALDDAARALLTATTIADLLNIDRQRSRVRDCGGADHGQG